MGDSVPIRISKDLRKVLGDMKMHKSESYDMLLRRKLSEKRAKKLFMGSDKIPKVNTQRAAKQILGSDKKATKLFLGTP